MIGFNLTATSNVGFHQNNGAWTEGSLWLAKKAVSKFAPKGTDMFTPDLLGAIESKFTKIKDILVSQVGGVDNLFWMNITGSILMSMKFDPSTPANIIIWRFLKDISLNNVDLGDEVMLQLCKCIVDFDTHLSLKRAFGGIGITPILSIEIQL